MTNEDLSDTIVPKSDQLNADDLLTGPITVTVTDVTRGSSEQPIDVHLEGRMPFRPCKSMRRVLIAAWGTKGKDWVGKSMTLYCDPSIKFGGVAVGGIRISHVSGISGPVSLMLTTTRAKRSQFTVSPLVTATYPSDLFEANLPKWSDLLAHGKMTADQIIERAGQRAPLTADQTDTIKQLEESL